MIPIKTLFITEIGSHLYNMDRPDSDHDYYKCYQAPSVSFLMGNTHMKGHQSVTDTIDISSFEIGHVLSQIKRGNINHVVGVVSNVVQETTPEHQELIDLVKNGIGKNIFSSVIGLSIHNFCDYIGGKEELFDVGLVDHKSKKRRIGLKKELSIKDYKKKMGQIGRTLEFTIGVLLYKRFEFSKCEITDKSQLIDLMLQCQIAYKQSQLPRAIGGEVLDNWLLDLRLKQLNESKCK